MDTTMHSPMKRIATLALGTLLLAGGAYAQDTATDTQTTTDTQMQTGDTQPAPDTGTDTSTSTDTQTTTDTQGTTATEPTTNGPADTPAANGETQPPETSGELPTTNGTTEQPAQDQAAQEPNLDIQKFGDWELRCETTSGNCFMYQLARDQNDNPVAEISIVALPDQAEAAAGVTVITPLGTALAEGVVMQVDTGEARKYPFNWCTRSGCYARFGLTSAEVDAMRKGAQALVRIVSISAPDKPVVLPFSLSGFTAAHKALMDSRK